jgi:N-acetylmuramoyl-L-alanine amidase
VTLRALILAAILASSPLGGLVAVPEAHAGTMSPASATATAVRVGGDDKQTRFVMDLDHKVDIAAFTLADPYRIVLDLPQVTFDLPTKAGAQGRGLIKEFRYGLIMEGGSRIVLDTKGPVRIDRAFVMAAADGQPARLVIDLAATDRDSFMRNMALQNHPARAPKQTAAVQPDSDPRPVIVIDPGHGGIDTGTHGLDGTFEKDIVLAFAGTLRDRLVQSGKYRVSVHADSLPKKEGQADGATIYTLSEHASDAEAARIADDENKSDVIAGVDLASEPDDVANILVDLAQRETKTFSLKFAHTVVDQFKGHTPMHKRPMKSAGFVVLKAPDVPSVLLELGYMSNRADLTHLESPQWRAQAAEELVQAVDHFFAPRLAGTAAASAAGGSR